MLQSIHCMIRSFKDRRLKRFYDRGDASKLPPEMVEKITDILSDLDVSKDVQEMAMPQYRLHPLTGNRKGQWAVTVRANWRIVFRFDEEPYDVELVDYH